MKMTGRQLVELMAQELDRRESVQARHADIDQQQRELLVSQQLSGFVAGGGGDDLTAEWLERGAIRHEVRGRVVDDQDGVQRRRLNARQPAPPPCRPCDIACGLSFWEGHKFTAELSEPRGRDCYGIQDAGS